LDKIKKAVILAAGLGKRFLPYTKTIPKPMLPIIDRPTLNYVINEAMLSGIEQILIVVGFNKEYIIDFYKSTYLHSIPPEYNKIMSEIKDYPIEFIEQPVLDGTGGAIKITENWVNNEPFAILNADEVMISKKPVLKQLIDAFYKVNKSIIGVQTVKKELATQLGIITYKSKNGNFYEIDGIKEKPNINEIKEPLANLGRYIATPKIFDYVKDLKFNKFNELPLTDAFIELAQSEGVFAYKFKGKRFDIGSKIGYLHACIELGLLDERFNNTLKKIIKDYAKKL